MASIVVCCLLAFASDAALAQQESGKLPAGKIDEKEFVRDIERAKAIEAAGKPAEAIAFWIEQKDKYAGREGYYENELGNFYLYSSDFKNAELTYLQGVALNARYPRLYIGLSLTYLSQKQFEEAQKWATRVTDEFPNWWLGYYTLGQIHWKQGHYPLAKVWLEKSLTVQRQPVALWLYGVVASELRDWQTCVDALKAAMDTDRTYTQDFEAMKLLAIALAQLGIYSEANEVVSLYKATPNAQMDNVPDLERQLHAIQEAAAKR